MKRTRQFPALSAVMKRPKPRISACQVCTQCSGLTGGFTSVFAARSHKFGRQGQASYDNDDYDYDYDEPAYTATNTYGEDSDEEDDSEGSEDEDDSRCTHSKLNWFNCGLLGEEDESSDDAGPAEAEGSK